LAELLQRLSHRPSLVEIWTDGSACVSRRSDYEHLLGLLKSTDQRVIVRAVRKRVEGTDPHIWERVHAKVIELQDETGRIQRIIGSANFTGAAWLSPRNTETICIEADRRSLPEKLEQGVEVETLSVQDIRKRIAEAAEGDPGTQPGSPWVYWAIFDEQPRPRVLTVCYGSKSRPVEITLHAHFDPRRDDFDGTKPKRDAIIRTFEDPTSWSQLEHNPPTARLRFTSSSPVPCLRLRRGSGVRRWGLEGRRRGHTRRGSAGRGP
jgi:hypothetical protein